MNNSKTTKNSAVPKTPGSEFKEQKLNINTLQSNENKY